MENRSPLRRRRLFRAVHSTLWLAALWLISGEALAQQMVVFDQVYTAELNDPTLPGAKFHHAIKAAADQPANWTSPIDYSKGTVYIHQEVMTKPSNRSTLIDICFDGDLDGYGCISTSNYTTVGTHETVAALTTTWQYEKIAWTKKRTEYHLVIKDPALGGTPGGTPTTDFVPSKMRIVMTIVPPGGKYTPPPPSAAANDGGTPATTDAGTTGRKDAAPMPEPDASAPALDATTTTLPADAATTAPDAASTTPPAKADAASTKPPKDPDPDPAPEARPRKSSGGCSVSGGATPDAFCCLLTALAIALGLRRRSVVKVDPPILHR